MIVLDANIIISFLEETDPNHRRAIALFKAMDGEYLFVPSLTWAEVLVGAIGSDKAAEAQNRIQGLLGVAVANPDGVDWPVQLAQVRARTGLRMPDAFVLAAAEVLDAKVATFDSKLAAVAANQGRLYEPPMA